MNKESDSYKFNDTVFYALDTPLLMFMLMLTLAITIVAIMDKVAIMAKYGHLALLAMAIAEFLNVIVSTLCDGAEFL